MASFLEDICAMTGRDTSFQDTHKKETLERLCDRTASLKVWEDSALSFLKAEGIDILNFGGILDNTFRNLVNELSDYTKELSDLDIPARSLNPASYGYLVSGFREFSQILEYITSLRNKLAYLAIVNVHHMARKLHNNLEYGREGIQQATAEQVSDIIRTTDEVDQLFVSIHDMRDKCDDDDYAEIESLLHDSIYEMANHFAILPSRLHMQEVEAMQKSHVNGGGFADIYKGTLSDGRVVALKVPRCFGKPDEIRKVHAELSKEGIVWHFSTHKHVLPLLGISCIKLQDERPDLMVLVTPWMANGTLREFLHCKPDTDRGLMIKCVASGVRFLHRERVPPVVHGDLRCDNILVNEYGVPKIADFGLSRVKDFQASLTGTSAAGARGSLRWQAPELLFPEMFGGTGKHTFASDIYALGMTCIEILTDEVPYFGSSDAQVITAVWHGSLPKVAVSAVYEQKYESQWEIVKRCWSRMVADRPSAYDLYRPSRVLKRSD